MGRWATSERSEVRRTEAVEKPQHERVARGLGYDVCPLSPLSLVRGDAVWPASHHSIASPMLIIFLGSAFPQASRCALVLGFQTASHPPGAQTSPTPAREGGIPATALAAGGDGQVGDLGEV